MRHTSAIRRRPHSASTLVVVALAGFLQSQASFAVAAHDGQATSITPRDRQCDGDADRRALLGELQPGLHPRGLNLNPDGSEPQTTGWGLNIDNDALTGLNLDEDYTFGLAVEWRGARVADWLVSVDPVLQPIQRALSSAACAGRHVLRAQQFGVLAFTPRDIEQPGVQLSDRPYASLVYVTNTRQIVRSAVDPVWQISASVGLLGTSLAADLQREFHAALGFDEPRGWGNQISAGGEPTARVEVVRQTLLASNFQASSREFELTSAVGGSIGYLTEASAAVSMRWGVLNSPWMSVTPGLAAYAPAPAVDDGPQALRPGRRERYLVAGAKFRVRPYNAMLQGQFRKSASALDGGDIEPLQAEFWVGLSFETFDHRQVSWTLRAQSPETSLRLADSWLYWGSLNFSF